MSKLYRRYSSLSVVNYFKNYSYQSLLALVFSTYLGAQFCIIDLGTQNKRPNKHQISYQISTHASAQVTPKCFIRFSPKFQTYGLRLNPDEYENGTRTNVHGLQERGKVWTLVSVVHTKLELSLRPPLDFKVTLESKKTQDWQKMLLYIFLDRSRMYFHFLNTSNILKFTIY